MPTLNPPYHQLPQNYQYNNNYNPNLNKNYQSYNNIQPNYNQLGNSIKIIQPIIQNQISSNQNQTQQQIRYIN
jgi:hypothetical protein